MAAALDEDDGHLRRLLTPSLSTLFSCRAKGPEIRELWVSAAVGSAKFAAALLRPTVVEIWANRGGASPEPLLIDTLTCGGVSTAIGEAAARLSPTLLPDAFSSKDGSTTIWSELNGPGAGAGGAASFAMAAAIPCALVCRSDVTADMYSSDMSIAQCRGVSVVFLFFWASCVSCFFILCTFATSLTPKPYPSSCSGQPRKSSADVVSAFTSALWLARTAVALVREEPQYAARSATISVATRGASRMEPCIRVSPPSSTNLAKASSGLDLLASLGGGEESFLGIPPRAGLEANPLGASGSSLLAAAGAAGASRLDSLSVMIAGLAGSGGDLGGVGKEPYLSHNTSTRSLDAIAYACEAIQSVRPSTAAIINEGDGQSGVEARKSIQASINIDRGAAHPQQRDESMQVRPVAVFGPSLRSSSDPLIHTHPSQPTERPARRKRRVPSRFLGEWDGVDDVDVRGDVSETGDAVAALNSKKRKRAPGGGRHKKNYTTTYSLHHEELGHMTASGLPSVSSTVRHWECCASCIKTRASTFITPHPRTHPRRCRVSRVALASLRRKSLSRSVVESGPTPRKSSRTTRLLRFAPAFSH